MRYYRIKGSLYTENGKCIDKVQFFDRPFETVEDAALWLSLNYPCYLLDSKMYEVDDDGHRKIGGSSLSFRAKDYLRKGTSVEEAIAKIQEVIEVGFFNMALSPA